MKLLLINQPAQNTIQACLPPVLDEGRGLTPPLGLMYLAAFLEKNSDHRVEILDCPAENIGYEKLGEIIAEKNPEIIGLTAMTFTLLDVLKTAEIAKKINPEIKIVLGGPHVMIYPEETIRLDEIDFLILGEGEIALKELLDNLKSKERLNKIDGLVFKEGVEIKNNGRTNFIANLDELPFPARHLTPFKNYYWSLSSLFPITTMFTSRGCPYKCLFCDRPHLGKMFRARSAKNVVEEMLVCQQMGIKEIFIYDDTFAVDRQRVLDICRLIEEKGIKIAWDIRTRVNTVDEEVLRALKKAGCQRIHYGVEAGTQRVLDVLRKGITLRQVKEAFALTKKAGLQTAGYFMFGSPTETKDDILETIKLLKEIKPDYVHITITTPYPATDLYQLAVEQGVVKGDPWREFARDPKPGFTPPIWEKELSRKELFALLKKAYRSFYFSPGFLLKQAIGLKSFKEFLNKVKAALTLLKI